MNNIVGIVPAGGVGKRMQPFRGLKELTTIGSRSHNKNGEILEIPKVLGEYTIENMVIAGVENIVIVFNENKSELLKFFCDGSQYNAKFAYICQRYENNLYGMPVAFEEAYPWISGKTVFMGMPDTIVLPSTCFDELYEVHINKNSDLTLGVFPTKTPGRLAPVKYDIETQKVKEVYDKPQNIDIYNTWNIMIWNERFTELIHEFYMKEVDLDDKKREIIMTDIINLAISKNMGVYCKYFENGNCFDFGNISEFNFTKNNIENEILK